MKISKRLNSLHQEIQEIENAGLELDYYLLYTIIEDAREFYETEGE